MNLTYVDGLKDALGIAERWEAAAIANREKAQHGDRMAEYGFDNQLSMVRNVISDLRHKIGLCEGGAA